MTTREIASHLAQAARQFPFLGIEHAEQLLEVLRLELGHEAALEGFQPYGNHFTRAIGPGCILHILSGNTPHAGLQSLIRGLLLNARNLCKIPSAGLPEIARFQMALPSELGQTIEISAELPQSWLPQADAMIVFGSDATIDHFAHQVRPGQIFIPHGHKVSFGIVFEDSDFESVPLAARDFSVFNQQGCLSPHLLYVQGDLSLEYARRLAMAMEEFNVSHPRDPISAREAAAIQELRQRYAFRAATGTGSTVWGSKSGTDWTVIHDEEPGFVLSCLNRVARVKPLPEHWKIEETLQKHFSTIGIWPNRMEYVQRLAPLFPKGARRVCSLGQMQRPPFSWHQDGGQNLAPLVQWLDWEA